jgi:hypothetical protein
MAPARTLAYIAFLLLDFIAFLAWFIKLPEWENAGQREQAGHDQAAALKEALRRHPARADAPRHMAAAQGTSPWMLPQ